MPYISFKRRIKIANEDNAENCGELNYCFCDIINEYLRDKKLSYQTINDILGALEGAKQEFYERVVKPYEKIKMGSNGDVWDKEFTLGKKIA